MDEDRWIEIGRIGKPHGLRGGLRFRPHDPNSTLLEVVKDVRVGASSPDEPMRLRPNPSGRIPGVMMLEGVDDRDAAERLRGYGVWVHRSVLPPLDEDEYYLCDLLGLSVLDEKGRLLGVIEDVMSTGAHDIYIVRGEEVGELMVPAVSQFVGPPNLEEGTIVLFDWKALRV